jgi:hypothetical protein
METTVTKEYVAGGVNVITTTVEFIPQDVIDMPHSSKTRRSNCTTGLMRTQACSM